MNHELFSGDDFKRGRTLFIDPAGRFGIARMPSGRLSVFRIGPTKQQDANVISLDLERLFEEFDGA